MSRAHPASQWVRLAGRSLLAGALVAAVLIGEGCSGPDPAHPAAGQALEKLEAEPVQDAVAHVNGRAVSRAEFEAFWTAHPDLKRGDALDALIDREVLVDEAIKRGYHNHARLQLARKQAMVRQLLADQVEEPVSRSELTDAEIDAMAARVRAQVGHPPGVRASHLVVLVPGKKKKATKKQRAQWFKQAHEWLGTLRDDLPEAPTAADLLAVRDRFKDKLPAPLSIAVNVHLIFPIEVGPQYGNDLPDGWQPVVPAFRDAAAAMAKEGAFGELSDPVKTGFGWHLVVPEKLYPAMKGDPKAIREVAIARLLHQKRLERLTDKMRKWVAASVIEKYPQVIADADKKHN